MTSHRNNPDDERLAELLARPAGSRQEDEDAEVLALRSALSSYRTEALQWAERRSATQPSLARVERRSRAWAAVPQWSLAAIAVITLAAGAVRLSDRAGRPEPATAAALAGAPSAPATATDLAEDNRLLSHIDEALSYHNSSPVDALNLKPAARPGTSTTTSAEATD